MSALVTTGSMLTCPHGGTVLVTPGSQRARTASGTVLRASDGFSIVACPFTPVSPHPCTSVLWIFTARRVRHSGDLVLNADSIGFCLAADKVIQGIVQIQPMQGAVKGV
jgi:hypothetical protein